MDEKEFLLQQCRQLKTNPPLCWRNLTLVPLTGWNGSLPYLLASEALEQKELTIQEISPIGQVNTIRVNNQSPCRILLLEGEELIGAKQNRIVNTTILLEARSTVEIPVSCVEQGRWHHRRPDFAAGGYGLPQIRAWKNRRITESLDRTGQPVADQHEIWEQVSKTLRDLETDSPTQAMTDAFEQQKTQWQDCLQALPCPQETCGLAAAVNGRLLLIDVFDKPDTLRKLWPRLIPAVALEAIRRSPLPAKPFTEKAAQFFLDGIKQCRAQCFKAVALGCDIRFESDELFGQALCVEEQIIHLAMFPKEEEEKGKGQGRIMPPAFRRFWHMH
jgi:hypothetical protein